MLGLQPARPGRGRHDDKRPDSNRGPVRYHHAGCSGEYRPHLQSPPGRTREVLGSGQAGRRWHWDDARRPNASDEAIGRDPDLRKRRAHLRPPYRWHRRVLGGELFGPSRRRNNVHPPLVADASHGTLRRHCTGRGGRTYVRAHNRRPSPLLGLQHLRPTGGRHDNVSFVSGNRASPDRSRAHRRRRLLDLRSFP